MTSPLHAMTSASNGDFKVVADACTATGIANAAIVISSTNSFLIGLSPPPIDYTPSTRVTEPQETTALAGQALSRECSHHTRGHSNPRVTESRARGIRLRPRGLPVRADRDNQG